MAALALLWRLYDDAYGWLHGLRDLDPGLARHRAYFRTGLTRYHWRPLRLTDGSRLRWGDRVLLLHLHSDSLTALRHEAASAAALGLALRRGVEASLVVLAERLATHPELAGVRAVGAVTHLWHRTHRLGFDSYPLWSGRWARLVAAYQGSLVREHVPLRAGRARGRQAAGRNEARWIWISTEALIRRYRLAASRVPTGAAA